jgi:lysyl-tRNA synthetase class I
MEDSKTHSSLEELENKELEGDKVAVGFRPSGSLHIGNLVTITYAAVLADELGLELDFMCCDTDWSAHIHEHHLPDENRVMKLFFMRECPCNNHANIAEHRMDEISEFLEVLNEETVEVEPGYLSEVRDEKYDQALRNILGNMDEFNRIFGGRFRERYRSPVAAVCPECGFSDAKGSAFSRETDLLVSACHNTKCSTGFMETEISEPRKGVYYLVDPVRDPGRDVAVHVFGGDYRDAGKGEKTPKVEKVRKITELVCEETPQYFLAPIIVEEDGKPLSKSDDTGVTVEEIDNLEEFTGNLIEKVRELIKEENEFVSQKEILG